MRTLVVLAGAIGLLLCLHLELSVRRRAALAAVSGVGIVAAVRRREVGRPVEDYHYLA